MNPLERKVNLNDLYKTVLKEFLGGWEQDLMKIELKLEEDVMDLLAELAAGSDLDLMSLWRHVSPVERLTMKQMQELVRRWTVIKPIVLVPHTDLEEACRKRVEELKSSGEVTFEIPSYYTVRRWLKQFREMIVHVLKTRDPHDTDDRTS